MVIKFPKEKEILSSKDAFVSYQYLIDRHLYFLKQQSKHEFFYWKGLGIFLLLSTIFFLLRNHIFDLSPLIGIIFVGIGILLMLVKNMKIDFKYGIQAAACVKKGINIDKKYDYPEQIFRIYEDNKFLLYRGNLLSRLFPLEFIALTTSIAGIILALKVSIWMAIVIALFSIVVLFIGTRFYISTTKNFMLGD